MMPRRSSINDPDADAGSGRLSVVCASRRRSPPSGNMSVARLERATRTESSVQTRSPAASATQADVALRRISTRPSTELTSADHSSQLRAAYAQAGANKLANPSVATAPNAGVDRTNRRRRLRDDGVCGGVQAIDDLIVCRERSDCPHYWQTPRDVANSYAELTIKPLG